MKKIGLSILLILALLLTGCAKAEAPEDLGWEKDWARFGNILAMEDPGHGFTLLDNKDALAASNLYYAAWVAGEAVDYENAEGETVDLYDAQIYLLMAQCKDPAAAEQNAAEWLAAEQSTYTVTDTQTLTENGIAFTLITYETPEGSPYAFGAAAFGVYQNYALTAELSCRERFDADARSILSSFLTGLHFAKENG